jgi:hypothetical protein
MKLGDSVYFEECREKYVQIIQQSSQAPVAYSCYPGYLGGKDWKNQV